MRSCPTWSPAEGVDDQGQRRGKPTGAIIDAAFAAAKAIGALDIGQAAVAIGGRAIALEGIEGTDGLLERTGAARRMAGWPARQRGVLVKCAKPGQELRADLPAIGPADGRRPRMRPGWPASASRPAVR